MLHTPGHTPEHLTFLITDGAVADAPIAAATGDFIFVGDVGRPDLLEKAANVKGTMEKSARTLYQSLQQFNRHEEWLQIWPGHGAGSSCGKGIPLGHLIDRLDEIPRDRPVVTQRQLGGRSAIAASILTRAGFGDVRNLTGGIESWNEAGLPTEARDGSQDGSRD